MKAHRPSPLEASFWLTDQEKIYLLLICSIFLIGLTARYFYLKDKAESSAPSIISSEEKKP